MTYFSKAMGVFLVMASSNAQSDSSKGPPGSPSPSKLAESNEFNHNTSAPVKFSGKTLKASRTKGAIQLNGDVVLIQDDTEVKADSARLVGATASGPTPAKKSSDEKQKSFVPKMAYLNGNVYLDKNPERVGRKEERITAKAHEVEYNIVTRKVVLKGKPEAIVTKGDEMIRGKTIVLILDTGEIEVVGARGVVIPGAHEKNKPQK